MSVAARGRRAVGRAALAVLGATTRVEPRPAAYAIRALFARTGRATGARLAQGAPTDVVVVADERYDPSPDALLDVYVPAAAAHPGGRRPVLVWVHGGGFVGGGKEELAGYLRRLADAGPTVVAVRYARAPEARFPTPVRQVLAALAHVASQAERYHADVGRVVLAGDSAGAHIAAQVATVLTNPAFARRLDLAPTLEPGDLRGVVLCCGVYDVADFDPSSLIGPFLGAAGWAYTGVRRWRDDPALRSSLTVGEHVTAAFPPTFLTVGDADPLAGQTGDLAATLAERGVEVEAYLPAAGLGHEYQFDLDQPEAGEALRRITDFVARATGEAAPRGAPLR